MDVLNSVRTVVVGGGLLMFSFVKLSNVERGYEPSGVLTFQVGSPQGASATFAEGLVARLRTLPGVRATGYASALPMIQVVGSVTLRTTADQRPSSEPAPLSFGSRLPPERPNPRYVSRDFLTVMGTRVLAGGGFGERNRTGPLVMLINQTLARSGVHACRRRPDPNSGQHAATCAGRIDASAPSTRQARGSSAPGSVAEYFDTKNPTTAGWKFGPQGTLKTWHQD